MSYDIHLGTYWCNYTSNLSKFFYDILEDSEGYTGIPCLDGKTGREGYTIIMNGLSNLRSHTCNSVTLGQTSGEYLSNLYDPPKGTNWGDVTSAILWLTDLAYICTQKPKTKIHVSY